MALPVTATDLPTTSAPLRGENFPVALGILPARHRRHLWALYRFARAVDDLGDEAPGDRRAQLVRVGADVRALYARRPVGDPVVAAMAATAVDRHLPQRALLALIEANLVDQEVHRYATFADLLGYCRLSADPVGELVLHVFGCATPDRVALSNRICTGLQLLEHLQDVGEDYAAGRIYLPRVDRERFGVAESDLGAERAGPALRALIGYQTDRALAWLNAGSVLSSTLRGWARVAVSGYVAGGRAAAARLRAAGYDPLPVPPKPAARHVAAAWLTGKVRYPG